MSHRDLSKILKIFTVIIALFCIIFFFLVLPLVGWKVAFVDGKRVFWQWAVFLWLAAIPCFVALYKFAKICTEISRDNSFSKINTRYLNDIAKCALIDSVFFFIGNLVFLILNMSTLSVFAVSLVIDCGGIAVSLAAVILSRLVSKAAEMKEENELTI